MKWRDVLIGLVVTVLAITATGCDLEDVTFLIGTGGGGCGSGCGYYDYYYVEDTCWNCGGSSWDFWFDGWF